MEGEQFFAMQAEAFLLTLSRPSRHRQSGGVFLAERDIFWAWMNDEFWDMQLEINPVAALLKPAEKHRHNAGEENVSFVFGFSKISVSWVRMSRLMPGTISSLAWASESQDGTSRRTRAGVNAY